LGALLTLGTFKVPDSELFEVIERIAECGNPTAMREIIIKTVYREDGFHVVRLGNGTVHKFPSVKSARKFLATTNRFLTDRFFELNQVLSELYTHSREIWIISKEVREADQLESQVHGLEQILKRSHFRSSYAAGNYFTFIDLRKFCEHSKSLIKFFNSLRHIRQTDTLRRHRLNGLFDQLQRIQMQLLSYGQSEAHMLFDTDRLAHINDLTYTPTQHLKIA
jgi:hypothetical protein